jgi:rRNA processing protein Gar1
LPPINISEQNIAPINLTVRGFDEGIQQVGTIQKVFGKDNFVYPLYGRKKYRNDNKWEYFVKFGKYGVILPIIPLRNFEELNTNDEVYIQSQKDKYRVTMYDDDIPQYLPFT